jgi:hypothetical protein
MRGGERKEGPLNKERGDGVGDGSLQSHSGVNLHLKTVKDRGNVMKGGKASLTGVHMLQTALLGFVQMNNSHSGS